MNLTPRDIFPVPRFVKVRIKPEFRCILDQPFVCGRLDLDQAIRILGCHRFPTDVNIESVAGKMRAILRKSDASRVRLTLSQSGLIFRRTISGNDP